MKDSTTEAKNIIVTSVREDGLEMKTANDEFSHDTRITGTIVVDEDHSYQINADFSHRIKNGKCMNAHVGIRTSFNGRDWSVDLHPLESLWGDSKPSNGLGVNWAAYGTQDPVRIADFCKLLQFSAEMADKFNKEFVFTPGKMS